MAAIVDVFLFGMNSLLPLREVNSSDSNDAPLTTQQTTTSAIEVRNVCAKTLDITIGFKETGPWRINNTNPITEAIPTTARNLQLTD
jgi:hypothetical protein